MTTTDRLVVPLADVRARDLPRVGGKGANLGELLAVGLPVPPGFCVTTLAFERVVAACPGIDDLYDALDAVAVPAGGEAADAGSADAGSADAVAAARDVGRRVREALLAVPVPQDVADAVVAAWQALGADRAYAVRSSATAEDLPGASFAGQQETYLDVRGEGALLESVRRCWASLFTDRAILYRARGGYGHRGVRLAVVVQAMVAARASGVLFTADPVTGHRHTLVVDAAPGLGEALVGGQVTPDAYRVDTRQRRIIGREPAPVEQHRPPVLTDEEVLELADLGMLAQAHFGTPQDLEWAVAEGATCVLQARPITSLFPVDGLAAPDGRLHVFFSMGHQQNMTRAMSPLGISCVRTLVPVGRLDGAIETSAVRANGGRVYADLTTPLRHRLPRRGVLAVLSQFDALAPAALRSAIQRPEFRGEPGPAPAGRRVPRRTVLRAVAPLVARVAAGVLWRVPMTVPAVDTLVEQHVAAVRTRLDQAPAGEAKVRATIGVLRDLHRVVQLWAPQFAAGAIAHRLLARLARSWAAPEDLAAYNVGLPGNAVTEMTLALGDLADSARRSPGLVALFDRPADDADAWLAQAATVEGSRPFLDAWSDFLARYGCRGVREIDIAAPRWYEDPSPLLTTVAGYLDAEAGRHRRQQEAHARAREQAVERLVSRASRGVGGPVRSRVVRRLVTVSHTGGVLREHHKYFAMRVLQHVKEGIKETARLLADSGTLPDPGDVWFLTLPELLALTRGEALDAIEKIPGRRADQRRLDAMTPPLVLTSDGEAPVVSHDVAGAPPGALVGQAVSAGVAEGTVRVVRDPATDTLQPGEILVAAFTDPGWTPLFASAGGLVTEVGGLLTHGSVVAREYGIPAVVGVREATSRLRTGQRARVDGSRGIVEIVGEGQTRPGEHDL